MKNSGGIVLSLNKVDDIDVNSANIILNLYRKAFVNDQLFYISGTKNEKLKKYLTH